MPEFLKCFFQTYFKFTYMLLNVISQVEIDQTAFITNDTLFWCCFCMLLHMILKFVHIGVAHLVQANMACDHTSRFCVTFHMVLLEEKKKVQVEIKLHNSEIKNLKLTKNELQNSVTYL